MDANYLLVTAAKNELQQLPKLIESIIGQTLRPAIWMLVDDGSEDGTSSLVDSIAHQHSWIRVIHRDKGPHHGLRYSMALREGFEKAQEICAESNIDYQYLGLVDADMVLEPEHFEKFIAEFERNPRLGLACCGIYHRDDQGNLILEAYRSDWPRGGQRVWRRACYEQIGGQPIAKSADSVGNAKVRSTDWEMRNFPQIRAVARASGTTKGHWAHCVYAAESAYYLCYHPVLVVMKALLYLWRSPHYGIVPFVIGYLKEWISRRPRCTEVAVQDYYGKQRLQEYWQYGLAHLLRRPPNFKIYWQDRSIE